MRQSQAMIQSPDRWGAVERLFHGALALPIEARATFLTEACAGDDELRRDVESLLAKDASANKVVTRDAAAPPGAA